VKQNQCGQVTGENQEDKRPYIVAIVELNKLMCCGKSPIKKAQKHVVYYGLYLPVLRYTAAIDFMKQLGKIGSA